MQTLPVLEVRVTHPFYDDQRCGDFVVAPTAASESTMRGLRMGCKPMADGVRIFGSLDETGNLFAVAGAPVALDFEMVPRGGDYAHITDLSAFAAMAAPVFTDQGGGDLKLIDRGKPARRPEALAGIALSLDDATLRKTDGLPRVAVVPLQVRSVRWCFYLLTDFTGDIADLRIVHAPKDGSAAQVSFPDALRQDLTAASDAGDEVAADLRRRNPKARIIRFLSDAPVRCRKSPLTALSLRYGAQVVVANLPNPPADRNAAVALTPHPAPRDTVIYEVVTLIDAGGMS